MRGAFHTFKSWSINSLNYICIKGSKNGLEVDKERPFLSQGAPKNGILTPEPILRCAPCFTAILVLKMILQTLLGLCPVLDPIKSELGKYIALNNVTP